MRALRCTPVTFGFLVCPRFPVWDQPNVDRQRAASLTIAIARARAIAIGVRLFVKQSLVAGKQRDKLNTRVCLGTFSRSETLCGRVSQLLSSLRSTKLAVV